MRIVDLGARRDTAPTSDEQLAASIARARDDTTSMLERARICMANHRDRALSEFPASNTTADRSAPSVASLTVPRTAPAPTRPPSPTVPPGSDADESDARPRAVERTKSLALSL